jgi:hypothetical protein
MFSSGISNFISLLEGVDLGDISDLTVSALFSHSFSHSLGNNFRYRVECSSAQFPARTFPYQPTATDGKIILLSRQHIWPEGGNFIIKISNNKVFVDISQNIDSAEKHDEK